MQKKNIWIINQYTGSPHYGMNYRSYYLSKEFIKNGNNVTIFSGSYSHLFVNLPETHSKYTKEIIDGINYVWVETPKYKSSKSLGRVWNMLVFMFRLFFINIFKYQKPDIIIISSLSLFPVLNAYIWAKIFKIEFIFEVRDIWPLTLIEVGGMSKHHPLVIVLGWFEKLGYKKAKHVVSVLPYAKEHMVSHGMQEKKFRFIPNGIFLDEVENYDDVSSDIKALFPKNKFIIGYAGTIGIANALEYLFESAELLKNHSHIHFVIVGRGGELNHFQQYCIKNKLSNITFIPAIPKKQVQSILKLFDVCYLGWHSKDIYEHGISANKLFDYMYSSTPILHSISIKNDIVREVKCGVTVDAEDSLAIKEAILSFSSTKKDELAKMGQNGKEYVIKNHSYKTLSKLYMEIL